MCRPRTASFKPLFFVLAAVMAWSCSSAPAADDDGEQFVGAPPVHDDDALFRHALPPEAVPAEATGMVGVPQEPAPEDPEREEQSPEKRDMEELALEAVDPEEPVEDIVEPPEDLPDKRQACFSCVRICVVDDDGNPQCDGAPGDLICGWGAHDDRREAQRTAETHCEASLDMARHMPNYADISGNCPPATCR